MLNLMTANLFAGMLDQITGGDSAICSQLTDEVESDVACQYANDGECDEPNLCAEVSDSLNMRRRMSTIKSLWLTISCL